MNQPPASAPEREPAPDGAPSTPADAPGSAQAGGPRGLGWAGVVARAIRVSQWPKNALVALAALFSRQLTHPETLARVVVAFFAFSLTASAVYLVNDLRDRESDRAHPVKRRRPIAAGTLGPRAAGALAVVALAGGLGLTVWLASGALYPAASLEHDPFALYGGAPLLFALAIAAYLALNAAYTLRLKQAPLWDVYVIAAGFALRALAGAFAAGVYISPWFYLTAIFLSLALATGKRRAELARAETERAAAALAPAETERAAATERYPTRRALGGYTLPFLDMVMGVTVTCALITYSLYTFQAGGAGLAGGGDSLLMLSVPCVVFGVFRYLYLVYVGGKGEQPDRLLLTDPQLLGAVALCGLIIAATLYGPGLGLFSRFSR